MSNFGHGGNVEEIARSLNINLRDLIDFSANINPLGLNETIKETMINSLHKIIKYPDITYYEARKAISNHEKWDINDIALGNGAAEIIFNVVRAIKPKRALIPSPTFSEYEIACRSVDCEILHYILKDTDKFNITDDFLESINDEIDLIFICNPNNPTGVLTKNTFIEKVAKKAKEHNCFVILDESFLDFVKNGEKYSINNLIEANDNLILIKSATKFFAIPGIRIGYGYFKNEKLKKSLDKITISWSINTLASEAIKVAFLQKEYIENTMDFVEREKDYLFKKFLEFKKLKPLKPSVNFMMFKFLDENINLYEELLKKKIIIRRCSNYEGLDNSFYRVAVRNREENEILIKALEEIL